MAVNRHQLMNELELKLMNDAEAADKTAEVAKQVEANWKHLALIHLTHGYSKGGYRRSIKRVGDRGQHPAGSVNAAGKKIGGQIMWHWKVVAFSDIAHFIEYGTGPDDAPNWPFPPNEWGHWKGLDGKWHRSPYTPTPVFALAARVEADFSGTKSALPRSKSARHRVKHGTAYTGDKKRRGGNSGTERAPGTRKSRAKAKVTPPEEQAFSSTKVRGGYYKVSSGGKNYSVEKRHDIPGQPWRASDSDAFHDPHVGDFGTRRDAFRALGHKKKPGNT